MYRLGSLLCGLQASRFACRGPSLKQNLPYVFHQQKIFQHYISNESNTSQKEKEIDWIEIDKYNIEDLPKLPKQEDLHAEEKFWSELPNNLKDIELDYNRFDLPEEELPRNLLRKYPLSQQGPFMSPQLVQLHLKRCMEEMNLYVSLAKMDKIFESFLEVRMNKLIPLPEMYEHVIAMLLTWSDHEAIKMLVEEMDLLGYPKGQRVYTTLLVQALLVKDEEKAEQMWKELHDRKFEIPVNTYLIQLGYYTRFTTSLDKSLDWYQKMKNLGVIEDSDPCNIMLDMCRANKLYDLAQKIYEEALQSGWLSIDEVKHMHKATFEMQDYKLYPRKSIISGTYLLMAEICCDQLNREKTNEFLQKAKEIHNMFLKDVIQKPPFVISKRLYENLVTLHIHYEDWKAAQKVIMNMLGDNVFPSLGSWKKVFSCMLSKDKVHEYLSFSQEFENRGYEYDAEIYADLVAMWYRVGDYRRAKNAYELIIHNGLVPNDDVRTAMMQVYVKAGYPDDIQKFYDDQIRSGRKMTRTMHEIMIDDFIERGYPGSARRVLQRMKLEGHVPSPETVAKIAVKYGDLGGSRQVMELINEQITGPNAIHAMTSDLLAAAIAGCIKEGNTNFACDIWEQYSPQILLTYESAENIIRSFVKLKSPSTIMQVYQKAKHDGAFKSTDPTSLFEVTIAASTSFDDTLAILNDMKSVKINITTNIYDAILQYCSVRGDVKHALTITKEFLRDYSGLPLNRGVVMKFFSIIARYDFGNYKREARAWLNRIVPTEKQDGYWFPDTRAPNSPLSVEEDTFLSTRQAFLIRNYIEQMDYSKIVAPVEHKQPLDSLFTGSDVDVEDILVHQYGFDKDLVHQALGVDPDYLETKKKLEELQASGLYKTKKINEVIEEE